VRGIRGQKKPAWLGGGARGGGRGQRKPAR
jgi:hypothetical protein